VSGVHKCARPISRGTVSGGGTYDAGSSVTATATPTPGYGFLRWTENGSPVSASADYPFTLTADRTLVAEFQAIPQYTLSLSAGNASWGTVSGGGTYDENTAVTARATPNAGYGFVRWTENGSPVSTSASYTFALTADRTLTAEFQFTPQYVITATDDAHSVITPRGPVDVTAGNDQTFRCVYDHGYERNRLTVDAATVINVDSYTFTNVSSDHAIAVTSKAVSYTVTYRLNGGSGVSDGSYTVEDPTFVLPEPTRTGYMFQGWYADSNFSGSPVTSIPSGSTGNKTFYAGWQQTTPPPTSDDAPLDELLVFGNTDQSIELIPAFRPTVYEYAATVPNDVTTFTVAAQARDSRVKIDGNGDYDLRVGENRIQIRVTIEDDAQSGIPAGLRSSAPVVYVIIVTRLGDTKNETAAGDDGDIILYAKGSTLSVKSAAVMKSIEVYAVTGKLVNHETPNHTEARINNLSRGIYMVRIVGEGGHVERRKVLIR
jgi:uncharacterized repeat protein (TIGR02543 family)